MLGNRRPVTIDPTTEVCIDYLEPPLVLSVRPNTHKPYVEAAKAALKKNKSWRKQVRAKHAIRSGAKKVPKDAQLTSEDVLGSGDLSTRAQIPALFELVESVVGAVDDSDGSTLQWSLDLARQLFGIDTPIPSSEVRKAMEPYADSERDAFPDHVDDETDEVIYQRIPTGLLVERHVLAAAAALAAGEEIRHEKESERLRPMSGGSAKSGPKPATKTGKECAPPSPKPDGSGTSTTGVES